MRIVQINAVYGIGSTGVIMQQLHDAITESGNESFCFWAIKSSVSETDRIIQIGNWLDHKMHALLYRIDGKQSWHSHIATRRLISKLTKIKPDIIHLHNLHSNYINLPMLLEALIEYDIPVLLTLHDCWFFTGGCYHYLGYECKQWIEDCNDCPFAKRRHGKSVREVFKTKKELYSKNKYLFVNGVSEWTTRAARESALLRDAKDIMCIYNWVDTDVFKPIDNVRENTLCKYGLPTDKKIVIGVSQNWSKDKGIEEFIKICELYKDSIYVVLVGNDDNVPTIENMKCVGYIKNRTDLCHLFNSSDLFVNASHMETFGLVTVEAMACGCPVVAYNNTGSSEIVDLDCGILVDDGCVHDLCKAVGEILFDSTVPYSINCVRKTNEMFARKTQISKYIDLYEKIAEIKRLERK